MKRSTWIPTLSVRALVALGSAALLITACVSHPKTAAAPAPALSPRCQAVVDSVGAITDLASLPQGGLASPRGFSMPTLPASTPSGTRVLLRYVARPDGTAEPGTVEILGIDDAGFRAQALMRIRRLRLLPAKVDGCPVRSRVDYYITKM